MKSLSTIFLSQQKLHLTHFLQISQISLKSDFIHIFNVYMYTCRGKQSLGGKHFMSTESPYHFAHLLKVSKNLFEFSFHTVFHALIHAYSPMARAHRSLGSNFLYQHKSFITVVIYC